MSFIIEFLPKKCNLLEFVYVVRDMKGFPLCVCDTLDDAKNCIQEKFDEMRKQSESNA